MNDVLVFDFPIIPHSVVFDSSRLAKRIYRCESELPGVGNNYRTAVHQFSFMNRYVSFCFRSLLIR